MRAVAGFVCHRCLSASLSCLIVIFVGLHNVLLDYYLYCFLPPFNYLSMR